MSGDLSIGHVRSILLSYGAEVMQSEEFQAAFYQTHHLRTTVAVHSINVAVISIILCLLLSKLHVMMDLQSVVQAALCHDLGILGREQKYHNSFECCQQHPIDSVAVAQKILSQYDDKTLKIIETHMWPARPGRPRSMEGVVVTLADKYAAVMEGTHRAYRCRHIELRPQ